MANEGKNKKSTTKKQTKGSVRKTSNKRPLVIMAIAILLIGAYFYFINAENKDRSDKIVENIPNYVMEKTGAGANANFTEKTKQIHTVVDQVLRDKNVTVLDTMQRDKTVNRQKIEGNISWNVRQMPVSIPNGAVDELRAALNKALHKIGAKIINTEPDQYNGNAAIRLDIGIEDELDGDQVTIIADKLYVMQKKTSLTDKFPPVSKGGSKAKIALVIDDFGYTEEPINAYEAIDRPLTFAVLPNHPYSKEAANRGYKSGRQIILHLPMEAMSSSAKAEVQTINVNMSDSEIRAMVNELTEAVPHIIGVNNHQGSKATSNQRVMKVVLNELASKGLLFIDSKTIASSIAYDTARAVGVKTGENKIFLDNSSDVDEIKKQLRQAGNIALKNGSAIAIGHARLNTAKAIKEFIPELEAQGIELVFASELLK
ncbi:MAG: protein of unknown function YibQ [Firmicutes bacterium]|nr:protein of unknown function YibQ [Bacillota bacterium]